MKGVVILVLFSPKMTDFKWLSMTAQSLKVKEIENELTMRNFGKWKADRYGVSSWWTW